jgi:hypothetical protein
MNAGLPSGRGPERVHLSWEENVETGPFYDWLDSEQPRFAQVLWAFKQFKIPRNCVRINKLLNYLPESQTGMRENFKKAHEEWREARDKLGTYIINDATMQFVDIGEVRDFQLTPLESFPETYLKGLPNFEFTLDFAASNREQEQFEELIYRWEQEARDRDFCDRLGFATPRWARVWRRWTNKHRGCPSCGDPRKLVVLPVSQEMALYCDYCLRFSGWQTFPINYVEGDE